MSAISLDKFPSILWVNEPNGRYFTCPIFWVCENNNVIPPFFLVNRNTIVSTVIISARTQDAIRIVRIEQQTNSDIRTDLFFRNDII